MHKACRVVIVHGWRSSQNENWIPWLKKELQKRKIEVYAVRMPNPNYPRIREWKWAIRNIVGHPDIKTFFIGYSIGANAILRYMNSLGRKSKPGGVLLVAPFLLFNKKRFRNLKDSRTMSYWQRSDINWKKLAGAASHFTVILSDNDPYVPVEILPKFKRALSAKGIILRNKKHITQKKVEGILRESLKMMEQIG